ncbi:hypothetical protein [Aeoliella mucimassa]|nr:hypothetical protein [Aeoliella mucimassa]
MASEKKLSAVTNRDRALARSARRLARRAELNAATEQARAEWAANVAAKQLSTDEVVFPAGIKWVDVEPISKAELAEVLADVTGESEGGCE